MKYLIASDVHGSSYFAEKILEIQKEERVDKVILLGDIYNHGPRNPLPKEYNPMKVASLLNQITDNLIVVKGNCDSQVDTLISEFEFTDNLVLETQGKSIYLSHGHIYNKDKLPKTKFDAVIYGHYHTGFIIEQENMIIANAGSIALPKDNTLGTYIILDRNKIILKENDGKVLAEKEF